MFQQKPKIMGIYHIKHHGIQLVVQKSYQQIPAIIVGVPIQVFNNPNNYENQSPYKKSFAYVFKEFCHL